MNSASLSPTPKKTALTHPVDPSGNPVLLDRDHSLVAFNERVFSWAERQDVPVLERLRYLCIVSSNLDEFFEVRADPHITASKGNVRNGAYTVSSFERLSESLHSLVDRQYALYNEALIPALDECGIQIVSHGNRTAAQRQWVKQYFQREIRPLLVPVGLDPSHPFPLVANKSLNFIVRLSGNDAFGRANEIAIVKVPRVVPRVIRLPDKVAGSKAVFVALTSVIRSHLAELFPGRTVEQFSQFRVTRHSDLAVDE
jgi:polyphosphate kinase